MDYWVYGWLEVGIYPKNTNLMALQRQLIIWRKGFIQTYSIDYLKTFPPVAKLTPPKVSFLLLTSLNCHPIKTQI